MIIQLRHDGIGRSIGIGRAAHQGAFWSDVVQRGLHFLGFALHSDPAQFQNAHDQLMRSQKPGAGLGQLLDDGGELLTVFGEALAGQSERPEFRAGTLTLNRCISG